MYASTDTTTSTGRLTAVDPPPDRRDTSPTTPVRIPAPRTPANGDTQILGDDIEWQMAHRPETVARARELARATLARWNTPDDETEAAVLVVSELVTNAVEHAQPPLMLHLHREHADHRVWIGVTDGGPATQHGAWSSSCAPDEQGRGLQLVTALAQTYGQRNHTTGTTYWARMRT